MATLSTEVLVIGGGATGAGVAWDAALRGFDVVLVDRADLAEGTSGRFHGLLHSGGRYAVKDPRAAEECIGENRDPAADRRRLRSRTPAGSSSPRRSTTPPTPTASRKGCRDTGVDCEEIEPAQALARGAAAEPGHLAGVPRAGRQHRRLEDRLGAWPAGSQERGARVLPYHEVVAIHRDGDQVTGARLRDAAHRRGARRRGPRDGQRLRRVGRPDRRAWPGSRASACCRAGGS